MFIKSSSFFRVREKFQTSLLSELWKSSSSLLPEPFLHKCKWMLTYVSPNLKFTELVTYKIANCLENTLKWWRVATRNCLPGLLLPSFNFCNEGKIIVIEKYGKVNCEMKKLLSMWKTRPPLLPSPKCVHLSIQVVLCSCAIRSYRKAGP